MKRATLIATILMMSVAQFAFAADTDTDWDAFSKNLVKALKIPNEGLQISAMRQITRYAVNLNVSSAAAYVMRFYDNHENECVRQLALVTLHKMNSAWAICYLRREAKYEESAKIKKLMFAILKDYDAKQREKSKPSVDVLYAEKQ